MKKYAFVLSIPLLIFLAVGFFMWGADETNAFQTKEKIITVDQYCESQNYVLCVFRQVRIFADFVRSHRRDPYPDNDFAQNDEGGCDLEFLNDFTYVDKDYDKTWRQEPIEHCSNWYAIHAAEIVLGKNYTTQDVVNLADWSFARNIDSDKKQNLKDFIVSDNLYGYCVNNEGGALRCFNDSLNILEKGFVTTKYVFSWVTFLIYLLPLIIFAGATYFAVNKYQPIFSNATVEWMSSRKQFRIFLVATIVWAAAFLIFSMFENDTINPFDDDDAWLPVILGLYPLLTFLITYFIVSAEDEKNNEST